MNRRAFLASLLIAFSLFLIARAYPVRAAQTPRAEDQLLQLVRNWLDADARGDHAALDRLIADDFMGFAHGNIVSKDDIAPADAPPKTNVVKYSLQESSVRLYGDTGVVMSRVVVEDPKQPGEFKCTVVFQKRGDAWKMIAAHMAR
jgi:ketosteroid isomerase-like protein